MKFKTGSHVAVGGTCLQGYVHTTYAHLVSILGEPTCRDGDKTTCEWDIEFEDGTIATVYDWKTDTTPMISYEWHIGGQSSKAVTNVAAVLNQIALPTKW